MSFSYPFIKFEPRDLPESENLKINYLDEIEDDKRPGMVKFFPVDITEKIHKSWISFFKEASIDLNKKLKAIYKFGYENGLSVYPNAEDCMNVFGMGIEEIRCVIVAQDPYPGWDKDTKMPVASGFCFATNSKNVPGSLERIRDSISENYGRIDIVDKNNPNNLKGWIDQGIFLLNNTIIVYVYKGLNSEKTQYLESVLKKPKTIWAGISTDVCKAISNIKNCPFILVGKEAEYLKSEVTKAEITVHPSKRNDCDFDGKCFLKISGIKWNVM